MNPHLKELLEAAEVWARKKSSEERGKPLSGLPPLPPEEQRLFFAVTDWLLVGKL